MVEGANVPAVVVLGEEFDLVRPGERRCEGQVVPSAEIRASSDGRRASTNDKIRRRLRRTRREHWIGGDGKGVLTAVAAPSRKIRDCTFHVKSGWSVGKVEIIGEIKWTLHSWFNQNVFLRIANKKIVFDVNVSRFLRRGADVQVNANATVVAGVVIDLVAQVVGHDATALRVVIDEVVDDFVVLAGDIVGEDAVIAVIVDNVVADDVVAGAKRWTTSVDG